MKTIPADAKSASLMVLGGLACVLIVLGFILGVVGLCGVPSHGRKGLLAPALTGTIINGLLILAILAALPALMKAKERADANRQSLAKVTQAGEDIQKAARKEILENGTNRQLSQKRMDELEQSVQNAAQNMTGDSALIMRASAGYMEQLNKLKKELDTASAELTAAKILVATNILNRQQLQDRRELVQNFLDANERSKLFLEHGAERYREELLRWHVPDKIAEETLRGYRIKADVINPYRRRSAGMRRAHWPDDAGGWWIWRTPIGDIGTRKSNLEKSSSKAPIQPKNITRFWRKSGPRPQMKRTRKRDCLKPPKHRNSPVSC